MTRRRFFKLASACVVWTMATSNVTMAGQPGGSAAAASALRISGAVTAPLSLASADFKSLPRTRVELKEPKDARASRSVRMLERLDVVRLGK